MLHLQRNSEKQNQLTKVGNNKKLLTRHAFASN